MPTFLELVGLLLIIWGAMAAVFVAAAWFGGGDDQESVELTANDAADPKVVDLVARLRNANRPRGGGVAGAALDNRHSPGVQVSHGKGDK